jgi:hypothetical protein
VPAPSLSPETVGDSIASARILLSEGRDEDALDELDRAVASARKRADIDGLELLGAELDGIVRYRPKIRDRALGLAALARTSVPEVGSESLRQPVEALASPIAVSVPPPPVARPPVAQVTPARVEPRVAASPSPPRRGVVDLAREWELLGPRGFAIVGGAVTALGIILLFVLATNRGWITPTMRVLMGAAVSAFAVGAGFWVRSRYGQMQMSLGAVGAGIAGGYATLAAATARYDLVPDWLALPIAGVIAAAAVVIAIAWSSEIVAAIGLVGAALAPALQAIGTGMTWTSAAFAVIVLAATVSLAVPRRWHLLLIGITAVVTAQVAWLAHASLPSSQIVRDVYGSSAGAGTVAVVAALVLVVLVAGIWLQTSAGTTDLDPLASSFAFAAVGMALLLVRQLYAFDSKQGLALVVAAVCWAAAAAALRRRQPSLCLVLGVSALMLAAVAAADLLSGTSLAVTWAAESALFSWLAWRLRDARLQAAALVYVGLAGVHVFVLDAPPDTIFHDPVSGMAAVSVAGLALAALAAGLLAPAETVARTETGLLAWLAVVRTELATYREPLRTWLIFGGAAISTYAVALSLVAISFRSGHLAATIVAATIGAVVTAASARRGSVALIVASLAWLAGVLTVAAAFDVPEFAVEAVHRSYGGWALIVAAAGALAGCFLFQLFYSKAGSPVVPGSGGVIALAASVAGIALLSPPGDVLTSSWIGWRLLAPALVLVALSASMFRVPRHRDLATTMWALGTVALLGSEWLVVQDPTWRALAFAVTAAVLALLADPLREARFWFAGWGLALAAAAGVVGWGAQPLTLVHLPSPFAHDFANIGDQPALLALGPFVVAVALFGIATLAWRDRARRDLVTIAWAVGIVALLDAEAFAIQDGTWIVVAFAVTASVVAALARPFHAQRLWLAGWVIAVGTALTMLAVLAVLWVSDGAEPVRYAIAALSGAAALAAVSALAWGQEARRGLVTGAWAAAIVSLIFGEAFLLGGGPPTAFASALTGGAVALLTMPLREERLWWAGAVVVSVTSAAVFALLTPPTHFLTASASPGEGLWVALGCVVAGIALHLSGPAYRRWTDPVLAVGALYLLSLAILDVAQRAFGGSVQSDFERGHVIVSSVWALIGLSLLIAGLIRDERLLRFGGLALFGLSLAKIFVYDLSTLNSAARAVSFIAVGALVLAGGFFLQKLSSHMARRGPRTPSQTSSGVNAPEGGYRECPHCNGKMPRDADVCPKCQRESPAWVFENSYWWRQDDSGIWHQLHEETGDWERYDEEADEDGTFGSGL